MSRRRIVVVGGGSQYSIGLSESLIDYAQDMLAGADVVLLDLHEEHLKVVQGYASDLASTTGVDISFEATTDRRAAFEGADFILTTFRPGSHREQLWDETIPPKYGLLGNETIGIGGIFMACRVVPLLREICADAQELCPQAWIINYTNPTQYVADAVRRLCDVRVISLCDGYLGMANYLAPLLNVSPEAITIYPVGTNHATWVMQFTVDGQDGYPLLRKRLGELSSEELDRLYTPPEEFEFLGELVRSEDAYPQFVPKSYFPFNLKLFQLYGLLPAPRYYWRYHLDLEAVISDQSRPDYVTMAGFFLSHAVPKMFARLDTRRRRMSAEFRVDRRRGGASHGDLAVRVISSIVNDLGELFAVNVPNEGTCPNLPGSAILEVPAYIDAEGYHQVDMGPLPKSLVGYQVARIQSQELAIDAAMSGDRQALLRAILADPLVHSYKAAEEAMDELLRLQADWLPQFKG